MDDSEHAAGDESEDTSRKPWTWGDEEGGQEAPVGFTDEQERILAEAELMLATGKTVEEIADLLRQNGLGKDDATTDQGAQ